jgi:hypothetical protein
MDISEIIRMISLVLAPVVMISCCTIFLNGQLQRYDSISMRMRALTQERFDILRDASNSVTSALETVEGLSELRVREIEAQLPHLLKRHRMAHIAVLAISVAILVFVISMCILALAAMLNSTQIVIAALLTFLVGMVALLSGAMIMLLELYQSNRAVRYEVLHALSLGKQAPSLTSPHKRLHLSHSVAAKKKVVLEQKEESVQVS